MNKKDLYNEWVDEVCAFLEKEGPLLGENGTHCATFQSKPILDKQPDVVFLGYNPHESWGYNGVDKKRFYEGNPSFYDEDARYTKSWRIWSKPYNAFKWADFEKPMTDGNFVFFNAVYLGSDNIKQLKQVHGSASTIDKCLDYTGQVIQNIFCPRCVICFSVKECFDKLDAKFHFENIGSIKPERKTDKGMLVSKHTIKCGLWDGITVFGIPHPSVPISNDDWGTIALYLKEQMQKLGI